MNSLHTNFKLYVCIYAALWAGVAPQRTATNSPPLDAPDCRYRESLDDRYARGLYFMNFDSVGVSYCYLTGSIHHAHEDHKKEFTKNTKDLPHTAGQPSRLSMFLVSRVQDNGTVIITGGGMVHEVPQDLENGLLHAPHRIHTGVVPHFEIRPDVIDFHRTKIYPRTTAADAPGPLVSQTTRTRPFRMDAKLVDSHAFMLRVQRWQRACNYSPDIMPEVPPWWEVLGLGSGDGAQSQESTESVAASSKPMVVLGVVSCPNAQPGESTKHLVAQIAMHAQYHVSIGLTAVLLYARSNMLPALVENEDILALVLAKKLFIIQWDEFAPHSTAGAQSHDWHLQRTHATLANSGIPSSDIRLLFLDANEFLILPAQSEEGCLHKEGDNGSDADTSAQLILNAWEVNIPVPEGTGETVFTTAALKSGQIQRACDTCKPGTAMVKPDKVFGLHLADALTLRNTEEDDKGEDGNSVPSVHRKIPEACAFIGRISALPGSPDASYNRTEVPKSSEFLVEEKMQGFWKAGVEWAHGMMSETNPV